MTLWKVSITVIPRPSHVKQDRHDLVAWAKSPIQLNCVIAEAMRTGRFFELSLTKENYGRMQLGTPEKVETSSFPDGVTTPGGVVKA